MDKQRIETLLQELAEQPVGDYRPGLAQDIKSQVPPRLHPHRGLDTINIIIDLRISRVAAAVVIIGTLLFFARFFHRRQGGEPLYEDLRLVLEYLPGQGYSRAETLSRAAMLHAQLLERGKQATYLGPACDFQNPNAVLMYWPTEEGRYAVVFSDLRMRTLSPEMLIRLQSAMIEDRPKK